jgi:Putative peptidoglycan binding domain/LysM domain
MEKGRWHTVKQGEWLSKIATMYMIPDWKTIWDDPNNAKLQKSRDPNILFPGDKLFIPEQKMEVRASGEKHKIVIKEPPETLRVTMLNADGSPIKDQKFCLTVGEKDYKGTTTGSGEVIVENLKLRGEHEGILDFPDIGMRFPVGLGHLNPTKKKSEEDDKDYDNGVSGLQMRLANLGFDPGPADGIAGPKTRNALLRFQIMVMERSNEKATGALDNETRDAIIKAYGN